MNSFEPQGESGKGIELVPDLRRAAADMADQGINGWGNLCAWAADRVEATERSMSLARKEVERLTAENRRLRSLLEEAEHTVETVR